MIHRLEINNESSLADLQKVFRKRLMTGGAVLRLAPDISEASLERLISECMPVATPHNVAGMVLKEIARSRQMAQCGEFMPLPQMTEQELREFFRANIGSDTQQIERRRKLLRAPNLPDDLVFLLGRDPDSTVRHLAYTVCEKRGCSVGALR